MPHFTAEGVPAQRTCMHLETSSFLQMKKMASRLMSLISWQSFFSACASCRAPYPTSTIAFTFSIICS